MFLVENDFCPCQANGQRQSYVEFHEESYDGKNVCVCVMSDSKVVHDKNPEKLENSRIFNNFRRQISIFLFFFSVLSYKWVKNKISKHRNDFEISSDSSQHIKWNIFSNLYVDILMKKMKRMKRTFEKGVNRKLLSKRI